MTIFELIDRLTEIGEEIGMEAEVLITDGHQAICYAGDFSVSIWTEDDTSFADIGIGGCEND